MLCLITFTNLKCNQDRHVVVFYPNWINLLLMIGPWTVRRSGSNQCKMTELWTTSLHQPQHHHRHQTLIWVWWRHQRHVWTLAPPNGHINSLIQLFKKLDLSARPMSPMMKNQVRFNDPPYILYLYYLYIFVNIVYSWKIMIAPKLFPKAQKKSTRLQLSSSSKYRLRDHDC